MNIEQIHESLVNGQRQQMVEQIDQFGLYDFFSTYREYLTMLYIGLDAQYNYFSDACISYNRIKNR